MKRILILLVLLLPLLSACDEDDGMTIRIPIEDGRASWEGIARGIARARGYDDSALEGLFPDGGVRLSGAAGVLLVFALNRAVGTDLRFSCGDDELTIRLSRRAVLASKRWFENFLQEAIPRALDVGSGTPRDFGLVLDPGWDAAPMDRPLVVLVHGFNSEPEKIDSLAPDVRKLGMPVGEFRYPNDGGLAWSARLLAAELAKVKAAQPERPVALACVSMGGLVARAVVEDPDLDPGNVRRLVMVAPPTHGILLAEFAWALEVGEFLVDRPKRDLVDRIYSRFEDGVGQAADDLMPGSEFLTALNARERNPRVAYSVFLGTKGTLTPEELVELSKGIIAERERNRFVRFFGPKLLPLLRNLDEVVIGKGDGAVALKRGRLEGVEDTEIYPFAHHVCWDDPSDPGSAAVRKAVLERLRRPLPR